MPNLAFTIPLRRILQVGALVSSFALAPLALADVYTWTDAQGTVHFSDQLGPARTAQRVASAAPGRSSWNRIVRDAPERHVLALERRAGTLQLRASLGGVEASFILDTGAQVNVIPLDLVRQLGIELRRDLPTLTVEGISARPIVAPVVTIPELRMGSVVLRDVQMAVLDSVSTGFLGMPVLEQFRFSIDPEAGTLVLEETKTKES